MLANSPCLKAQYQRAWNKGNFSTSPC